MHPNPGNRSLAKELGNVRLDRAYIGSCTGGKTSDFVAFAEVVNGKRVQVETYGVPGTSEVVRDLKQARMGGTSVWDVLVDAGREDDENASCAACLGGPQDTFGRLNSPLTCISATNRNFPGRMGSKESKVYLASPYTVAASCINRPCDRSARIPELIGTLRVKLNRRLAGVLGKAGKDGNTGDRGE